ncbi:MAG TPA: YebC/PmpR family DNA-binding transcriptional regulator [Desulfuromonadaceae bacterium]|nr:YebC/PmpR family DNA-binding transcriptional regulator [Desulfuromonadaceae bacterium]
MVQSKALEAGAEDFQVVENKFEILKEPATLESVHKKMEATGTKLESAVLASLPAITVPPATGAAIGAIKQLIAALEEHDDVKEVISNAEFPEEMKAA